MDIRYLRSLGGVFTKEQFRRPGIMVRGLCDEGKLYNDISAMVSRAYFGMAGRCVLVSTIRVPPSPRVRPCPQIPACAFGEWSCLASVWQ